MVSEAPPYLRKACIVAAHPDDEILWFSALARRVERVFLCYLNNDSRPQWGRGRRAALALPPLSDFVLLGLDEADVFDLARWPDPLVSLEGLVLEKTRDRGAAQRYHENFRRLTEELGSCLRGFDTVFTHNPWGEYGHEEHVQVYRAVRAAQADLGFDLWCSAYGGSRSAGLMGRCLEASTDIASFSLDTDREFAEAVAARYRDAGVWTWFPEYVWPEREHFLRLTTGRRGQGSALAVPINYLDMGRPLPGLLDRSPREIGRRLRGALPWSPRPKFPFL